MGKKFDVTSHLPKYIYNLLCIGLVSAQCLSVIFSFLNFLKVMAQHFPQDASIYHKCTSIVTDKDSKFYDSKINKC